MKNKLKTLVGMVLAVSMCLCGCKKEAMDETVPEKLSTEIVTNLATVAVANKNATEITEEIHGDYRYWYPHAINNTERKLWDMTVNKGAGCKYENFIYNTQLCNATDIGYELGYPLTKFVEEKVTEQNVMWTLSGLTLGEWADVEDGSKVKYDNYECTSYKTVELNDYEWYFIVNNYTMTTDTTETTNYFNILGISEYMGDWLTIELTGNYTENDSCKDVYTEILSEFCELYGFCDVLKMTKVDSALFLLGEKATVS